MTIMKKSVSLSLLVLFTTCLTAVAQSSDTLPGAWRTQQGDIQQTAVFVDGYLSHSIFDTKNKKFISTRGGTYTVENGKLAVTWQYDTEKATNDQPNDVWVGTTSTFDINMDDGL